VGVPAGVGLARAWQGDDDARIRFTQRGGDVWAASMEIQGVASGCDEVRLRVGEREHAVPGGRFEERVTLAEGTTAIVAECGDARAEQSLVRRLPDGDQPEATPATVAARPRWVDEAVVYGVIPRNFGETGGFRDVTGRLDELARLGVTAIWLSPINRTPEGDFGYAVTEYVALRDDYGIE